MSDSSSPSSGPKGASPWACPPTTTKPTHRDPSEGVSELEIDPFRARLHRLEVNAKRGALLLTAEAVAEYGPLVLARDHRRRPRGPVGVHQTFITLTYQDASAWCAGHIGAFVDARRVWAKRRGVKYRAVWVAELQRRGAVHYHVLEVWPSTCERPPFPDRGQWSHGHSNAQWVKADAVRYLAKYLSKGEAESDGGAAFPRGCRTSGVVGLSRQGREVLASVKLPQYVRDASRGLPEPLRRAKGGGWCDPRSGEILPSWWRYAGLRAGRVVCVPSSDAVTRWFEAGWWRPPGGGAAAKGGFR